MTIKSEISEIISSPELARNLIELTNNVRLQAIEECARELETSYPDHAWLNAACAAIRSLAVPRPERQT